MGPQHSPPSLEPAGSSSHTTSPPSILPGASAEQDEQPLLAATAEPKQPATDTINSKLKDPDIKDYGWNTAPINITAPLVHGLSNDDLYALLRRFNKQIFHVKAIPAPPVGSLDLEISTNEEFSPDKLRATLERVYMTVIVGMAALGKHIARLRSWNEPRRTAGFCAAYYAAWYHNFLLPLFLLMVILLILDAPTRKLLFPQAPLALVSAVTGNLQQPKAGKLGSKDSLSGASEVHKGEAVEQEARHFVSGVASMAVSTAIGKGPGEDGNGNAVGGGEAEAEGIGKPASSVDGAVPDPVALTADATQGKHLASGDNAAEDAAKQPVEDAIWDKARPFMLALGDVADGWERWANALSAKPPFPKYTSRLRLAAPLLPILLATCSLSAAFFIRVATFSLGIGLFGQPIITRFAYWLTTKAPNWREYLELRRTLLVGVPTNAQFTLTLLRIAEANKAPLPPPPTSADGPSASSDDIDASDDEEFDASGYDVDTSSGTVQTTGSTNLETLALTDNNNESDAQKVDGGSGKRKAGQKIAAVLKRTVKAGVNGALSADYIKAMVGSEDAKNRIGAVSDPPSQAQDAKDPDAAAKPLPELPGGNNKNSERQVGKLKPPVKDEEGPCAFSGRLRGKRGHVLLVSSAASPCISFVYTKGRSGLANLLHFQSAGEDIKADPEFTVGLSDITELRKVGGFGWKGKMIVGWSLGREVVDGIEIVDKMGVSRVVTAIRGRDELFNRLIAIGGQKWESW